MTESATDMLGKRCFLKRDRSAPHHDGARGTHTIRAVFAQGDGAFVLLEDGYGDITRESAVDIRLERPRSW